MGLNPSIRDMLAADVTASMADQSAVLEFRQQVAAGTSGVPVASADVAEEGILATADLEWVGRVADFPRGVPTQRDTVKVDGVNYWVLTAQNDGAAITLALRKGPQ